MGKAHAEGTIAQLIDLRSDTVTAPTQAMRHAMEQAELGESAYREDPSENDLEKLACHLTNMEAAVLFPSGTQGNLAAILAHCRQSSTKQVLVGSESHVQHWDAGEWSELMGLTFLVTAEQTSGEMPLPAVEDTLRSAVPQLACICIENTHNYCGGKVLSATYLASLRTLAKAHGVAIHMDGSRIFNAAAAWGAPVSRLTAFVDSIQFCLAKGLGAPAGAIVAGQAHFIEEVRKYRRMLGGGMHQAGVLAAPGIIALRDMPDHLYKDHSNARALARGLAVLPMIILDPTGVHSNIVVFNLRDESRLNPRTFCGALQQRGVLMLPFTETTIRAVTHLDVTSADILTVVQEVRATLLDAADGSVLYQEAKAYGE